MKYFKYLLTLVVLSVFLMEAGAQNIQRYKDISFTNPDSVLNIPYGSAQNLNGKTEELLMDVYSPGLVDTATKRPLMIFIHGGGFQNNIAGTADKTVPFDSSFNYHGFKYGSTILFQQAKDLGIPTGLRLFEGTGHTLDNNRLKQDSALQSLSNWLFLQLRENTRVPKAPKPGKRSSPMAILTKNRAF